MTEQTVKPARAAAISATAFIAAVASGRKDGKSNKEIAESLGMNIGSFNVRVATENKSLFNATSKYEIGNGKDKRTVLGHELAKEFKVPVAKLNTEEVLKKIGAKHVADGKRLPGSTASRGPGQRTDYGAIAESLFGEADAE